MTAIAIRLRAEDNVATLLEPVVASTPIELSGAPSTVDDPPLVAVQDIPFGHKIAVRVIAEGAPVLKYGETIGAARHDVRPGEHVHQHNVRSLRGGTLERE